MHSPGAHPSIQQAELAKLRAMIKIGGSIENPSRVREIRRAIARILTVEAEERTGGRAEG